MSIRETLNQNWVSAIIGVVGAIVGVLGTILVGYLFSSRARLATQINSLQLLGPNPALPSDIEFLFKGQKVPNVTLSRIAIWNIGNITLLGEQIVENDPLRIVTSEGSTILEATILNCTRNVNGFSCSAPTEHSNQAVCTFDYLDPRDGVLIQVIHTGKDEVNVVGTLRGIRQRILNVGSPVDKNGKEQTNTPSAFFTKWFGFFLALAGLGIPLPTLLFPQWFDPDPNKLLIASFGGVMFASLGIWMFWIGMRMPPRKLNTQITTIKAIKPFWGMVLLRKFRSRP